jgi:hypothetical protein
MARYRLSISSDPRDQWDCEFATIDEVLCWLWEARKINPNTFNLDDYDLIEISASPCLYTLWAEYKKQREGEPQDG